MNQKKKKTHENITKRRRSIGLKISKSVRWIAEMWEARKRRKEQMEEKEWTRRRRRERHTTSSKPIPSRQIYASLGTDSQPSKIMASMHGYLKLPSSARISLHVSLHHAQMSLSCTGHTWQPTEWNDTVSGMIYEHLDTNHIAGCHVAHILRPNL